MRNKTTKQTIAESRMRNVRAQIPEQLFRRTRALMAMTVVTWDDALAIALKMFLDRYDDLVREEGVPEDTTVALVKAGGR